MKGSVFVTRAGLYETLEKQCEASGLVPAVQRFIDHHKTKCGPECEKYRTAKVLFEAFNDSLSAKEPILLLLTSMALAALVNKQMDHFLTAMVAQQNAFATIIGMKKALGGNDG